MLLPATADAQSTCRTWRDGGTRVGTIEHEAINESSGLARSERHPHVLWTHNDSGGQARLFAVDTRNASHRGVVRLERTGAVDWEDAAKGPCPPSTIDRANEDENASAADAASSGDTSSEENGDDAPSNARTSSEHDGDASSTDNDRDVSSSPRVSSAGSPPTCLYVADIGDNGAKRDRVVILAFPEPDLPTDPSEPVEVPRSAVTPMPFIYPDGPRDAETLLVHPSTSEMYVVTKTKEANARVYRIPPEARSADPPHEAEFVTTMSLSHPVAYGRMATGGDISPSGQEMTIRSYLSLFTFCVPEDDAFEAIFDREPRKASPRLTVQSEALAYGSEGDILWTTSERRPAPLIRMRPRSEKSSSESSESSDAPSSSNGHGGPSDRPKRDALSKTLESFDCGYAPAGPGFVWLPLLLTLGYWRRRGREA